MRKFVKKFFNKYFAFIINIFLYVTLVTLLLIFINEIFYGFVIWGQAQKNYLKGEYRSAIPFYNYALNYYSKTAFIKNNQKKYVDGQYLKAICYLETGDKKQADLSVKEGTYLIMNKFGQYSKEYAQYIRQNVVRYYIRKGDYKLAKDYLKLSEYFYLKVKMERSALVEINLLYGDWANAIQQKKLAEKYYDMAYSLVTENKSIPLDLKLEATKKAADFKLISGNFKLAVFMYTKLLDNFQKDQTATNAQIAELKWALGNIYFKMAKYETAMTYYDDAYYIVSKLSDSYELRKNIDELRSEMVKCYLALGRYYTAEKMQKQIKVKKTS